jgi:hypothetical protein
MSARVAKLIAACLLCIAVFVSLALVVGHFRRTEQAPGKPTTDSTVVPLHGSM